MDNRVWVKDAVMTIRLPEEVDHFVADRLREEAGEILVERNVREVVFVFLFFVLLVCAIHILLFSELLDYFYVLSCIFYLFC